MGMLLRRLYEKAEAEVGAEMPLTSVDEEVVEHKYTKSELTKMSVAQLKEVAVSEGIEGAEEMSGTKLKELLVIHFGL